MLYYSTLKVSLLTPRPTNAENVRLPAPPQSIALLKEALYGPKHAVLDYMSTCPCACHSHCQSPPGPYLERLHDCAFCSLKGVIASLLQFTYPLHHRDACAAKHSYFFLLFPTVSLLTIFMACWSRMCT